VSSGRGGLFPRGVVIGTVIGIEEADTGWRKSYLIRPAVRPEAASHVMVGDSRRRRRPERHLAGLRAAGPAGPDTADPGGSD
jgi:cell shape-determining protein MreC